MQIFFTCSYRKNKQSAPSCTHVLTLPVLFATWSISLDSFYSYHGYQWPLLIYLSSSYLSHFTEKFHKLITSSWLQDCIQHLVFPYFGGYSAFNFFLFKISWLCLPASPLNIKIFEDMAQVSLLLFIYKLSTSDLIQVMALKYLLPTILFPYNSRFTFMYLHADHSAFLK